MTCWLPHTGPWMTLVRHTGHSLATVLKKMPWMTCWQWKSICITMLGYMASLRETSREWVSLGLKLKHFPVIDRFYIDLFSLSVNKYACGILCLDMVVKSVVLLPQVVLQLLHRLNLMAYKDRVTSMCSYGTNRKLSTALALIGNPSILLLVRNGGLVVGQMSRSLGWQRYFASLAEPPQAQLAGHSPNAPM